MDEQLFWQQLNNLGGFQHAWWYNAFATPAMLTSLFALIMVTLAVRQIEHKVTMFLLFLLASVPIVLIVPSFYTTLRPQEALQIIGMEWPSAANKVPRQALQTLSLYLDFLAQLGVTGAVLGVLIGLGALTTTASTSNVPVISTAARQITQVVRDRTQRLRRSLGPTSSTQLDTKNCPYGLLEVLDGAHKGKQAAVRPGHTLGRQECDILITDAVASRKHARLGVDDHNQTTIADQQSANGLFVYRTDEVGMRQKHDLTTGTPFVLRSGDIVTLGDPDGDDGQYVVRLRFERDYM